jgi:hypothetical protein
VVDRGQHVLEAVAELVEERLDLVERHERRLPVDGGRLVAHQVRHRLPDPDGRAPPSDALVHPCPAALLGRPAVGIEKEGRERRPVGVGDPEEADVGMPRLRLAVGGRDADAEEPLG